MAAPHVVILGAGPAGLGAAYRLRAEDRARVTVLERQDRVGGNAGSFEWQGQRLDYGSHRLHPASDPEILADIRALLGADLLDRPRHGRIRLLDRWIHFPLKPVDLVLRLPKSFALGSLGDAVKKTLSRPAQGDTFASVLEANLGRTICRHFYFPYAVKLWGHDPADLSGIQAQRRVSAGSFAKLLRKVLGAVPGLKSKGAGRFFYPRRGYGQISEAYAEAARERGAELRLSTVASRIRVDAAGASVAATRDGSTEELRADHVWSTVPITLLAKLLGEQVPEAVRASIPELHYRSMLLIYLRLPVEQFAEYDAHYFPGADLSITRLSEPKNYPGLGEPRGFTTLCAELPCREGDEHWRRSEAELAGLVAEDLRRSQIPLPCPPSAVHVARLPQAYPIYRQGYEEPFRLLDEWLSAQPRLLSYGRQGLFAHDNTHHALAMAYAASRCLGERGFDRERWAEHRERFATHVVED